MTPPSLRNQCRKAFAHSAITQISAQSRNPKESGLSLVITHNGSEIKGQPTRMKVVRIHRQRLEIGMLNVDHAHERVPLLLRLLDENVAGGFC